MARLVLSYVDKNKMSGQLIQLLLINSAVTSIIAFLLLIIIIYLLTAIGLTPGGSGYIHVHKHKLGI